MITVPEGAIWRTEVLPGAIQAMEVAQALAGYMDTPAMAEALEDKYHTTNHRGLFAIANYGFSHGGERLVSAINI